MRRAVVGDQRDARERDPAIPGFPLVRHVHAIDHPPQTCVVRTDRVAAFHRLLARVHGDRVVAPEDGVHLLAGQCVSGVERVPAARIRLDVDVHDSVNQRSFGVVGREREEAGFGIGSRNRQRPPLAGVEGHRPVGRVGVRIGDVGCAGSRGFHGPAARRYRRHGQRGAGAEHGCDQRERGDHVSGFRRARDRVAAHCALGGAARFDQTPVAAIFARFDA